MFAIVKRILALSGAYQPRVIIGIVFSILKSCCAALPFFALLLIMTNINTLTATIIGQAFAIVTLSVAGRFLFQYLTNITMSVAGYDIFRDRRLEIGEQLKRAPWAISRKATWAPSRQCSRQPYLTWRAIACWPSRSSSAASHRLSP